MSIITFRLKHHQEEMKTKQKESRGTEKKYNDDKKTLDHAVRKIEQLKVMGH